MASMHAHLRFYAELNDLLPASKRFASFVHDFEPDASVKEVIEGLGVPHTVVDMVVVGGRPVDFSYRVRDGDRISVYPVFESLDLSRSTTVHARPLRTARFVVDPHLDRLAHHLRLSGFDTLSAREGSGDELVAVAREQGRVLLTRDAAVLERKDVSRGYLVRAAGPRGQLLEVLRRFDLLGAVRPLERCMRCNDTLRAVGEDGTERRPGHADSRVCSGCGRVYRDYERLARAVAGIASRAQPDEQGNQA